MGAIVPMYGGALDRKAPDGTSVMTGPARGAAGTCARCAGALGAALLLWVGFAAPGLAQTARPAPHQAHSSRAEAGPPGQAAGDFLLSTNSGKLADAAAVLMRDLQPILAAAPRLPDELSLFAERVGDPAGGSLAAWLLHLAVTFGIALAALALLPRLFGGVRRTLGTAHAETVRLADIVGLLAIDALGVLALAVVAFAARALWFGDPSMRNELAVPLVAALVYWRALLLPIDLVLRPDAAPARLVDLTDAGAARLHQAATWLIGLLVFSIAALRALLDAGLPFPCVQVLAIPVGLGNAAIALGFIRRERKAQKAAFAVVVAEGQRPTHRLLARIWQPAAVLFVVLVLLAWLFGVLVRDLRLFWTLLETAGIVLAVWVLETIVALGLERTSADPAESGGARRWRSPRTGHCLAVGLWLVAAAFLTWLWLVDRFHLLSAARWSRYSGSALSAIATLYVAYVLSQAVLAHTERRLAMLSPDADAAQPANGPPPIGSRLQTMLPLLRFFVVAAIGVVAVLIALSALGINTNSLIAGASIFGLAISFGSQSLVRDIVSGVFFMADDAFRIGEYIDTGKLKGTVEGMSIRSLR
ncbi:MAG TPA: mechanosensitive ion channel domain-containing protein, partial [Stellaceae bacterium]|nr:mechanosensitive ion channel domain-containing protein [Stellaceae bacterium]